MNFLIQFIIMLIYALLTKAEVEEGKAPSKSEIELPTNSEKRNIPIIFGTVLVKSVNIIYAGQDYEVIELTKKVKTGLFSSDTVTIGWKHLISMATAIGFGKIKLLKIYFNDRLAWSNEMGQTTGEIIVDAKTIFKSEQDEVKENGVSGECNFYDGSQIIQDDYLNNNLFATTPPYYGLSYIVFKHFYFGNTAKPIATPTFEVSRIPKAISLGDDHLIINEGSTAQEANPAEIIYDIMTNNDYYGIGIPAEEIDTESFQEVAAKLKQEKFGLSIALESGSSFEDIKNDICNHIAGNVFRSPYTGLWKIKLNRKDYDVADLRVFNKSNVVDISYSRRQILNLFNEVKVNYVDRSQEYVDRTASADNKTIRFLKNQVNSKKIDFRAIKTSVLAAQVAAREIAGLSKNLISLNITTNRLAYGLEIGDVIVVDYPEYNVNNLVFRIQEINLGKFNDNRIKIKCIQDVWYFGVYYGENGESNYQPPQFQKYSNYKHFNISAPYAYSLDIADRSIFCLSKNSNRDGGFEVYSGGALIDTSNKRTPVAYLDNVITKDQSIFTGLKTYSDISYLSSIRSETTAQRRYGNNLAIMYYKNNPLYHEFISFSGLTENTGSYTMNDVWRGCFDTIPKVFDKNIDEIMIMFFSYGSVIEASSSVYDLIALYNNLEGSETLVDDATKLSINNRRLLPLLPYSLKVNGVLYQAVNNIGSGAFLTLDWSYSNRIETAKQVTKYSDTFIAKEDNVVYNIKIYDNTTNTLLKNHNETTNTYTFSDESPLYSQLRVVITATMNGYVSFEKYEFIVNR